MVIDVMAVIGLFVAVMAIYMVSLERRLQRFLATPTCSIRSAVSMKTLA